MTRMTYRDRDLLLQVMGYRNYSAYLFSDVWKVIRIRLIEKHGTRCKLCGKYARQFHHCNYAQKTLEGKDLTAIHPICDFCHHRVEFRKDGNKRPLSEVARMYTRLYRARYKSKIKTAKAGSTSPQKAKRRRRGRRKRKGTRNSG